MIVDILDSVTLQQLQGLKFSHETSTHPVALAFSPDTHMLTSLMSGPLYPSSQ